LGGSREVTGSFAYGFSSGFYFLVQLKSERKNHGIYQWRFLNALGKSSLLSNLGQQTLNSLSAFGKGTTGQKDFDLSVLFGDPLRSF
jgi:hypothetical protein